MATEPQSLSFDTPKTATPPPQPQQPPAYGSGRRPELPDWGIGNIFDPFGALRTASVGGDLLSTDPFWQFDAPPAPPGPRPAWDPTKDPYGFNLWGEDTPASLRAAGNTLKDSRDAALTSLAGARDTLVKFQQGNDDALAEAKSEWGRAISEYKDFSAASVQRSLRGIDKQFEQNAEAFKEQAAAAGIPRDQIDGQINIMRMQSGYEKGTMIGEASSRVNENRLAAETQFYNTYFGLVGSFQTAEAQLGMQYDLASADIQKWWGESWSGLLTQAELAEMQADLMELNV